ncbi:hypothetical protein T459_09454 [Capsicum annuum]|uniref:PGG domain-containing protein n=1 Tax=Capsicum annuum TaxID=4072 RepID=A0A2G2ZZH0_CAPAN|nr:hypothetical protein T459_09454 [Capsicum annuum]
MESTLYNAAMRGNIGNGNFLLADHLKRNEENGYQVTPKGNTVLHVASLYGNSHLVEEGLKITPALLCYKNKKNETALLIAANEGHTEVVHVLLARIEDHNTKEKLTRMTGPSNRTPLHAAVIQEHKGSENDWMTAIHIASSEGDVNMINKLLNHCPDCWDMLDSNNQNALHVAVLNNQDKEKLVEDLCSIGRFEKRDFEVKRKYEYMHNPNAETGTGFKMQLREVDHDKTKKADQIEVESIMKAAQIHIVVATLIMTVPFGAGITLPGGFESDSDSPNQGMAILIRKTTFHAFVVSDAIAFTFSVVAIFIYFLMADTSRDPQSKKIVKKLYDLAGIFQCLSMLAVVIAFAMGMFATLSHSLGLAVTVCSIGCLSILLYFLVVIYICRYMKNISE